jgi:hypothetical protein
VLAAQEYPHRVIGRVAGCQHSAGKSHSAQFVRLRIFLRKRF